MALSLDTALPCGLALNGVYLRIVSFSGDKTRMIVDVDGWVSQQARNDGLPPVPGVFTRHVLEIPNGATLGVLYDALKALPEYADAVDV